MSLLTDSSRSAYNAKANVAHEVLIYWMCKEIIFKAHDARKEIIQKCSFPKEIFTFLGIIVRIILQKVPDNGERVNSEVAGGEI